MRSCWRRRRHDGGVEDGAVALEAALIFPLLALLVFGMVEMSLMLRDYVSLTAASRSGVRVASTVPFGGTQDCDSSDSVGCAPSSVPQFAQDAADSTSDSLSGVPRDSVDYMYVYLANDAGYPCKSVATKTGSAKGVQTCNDDCTTTGGSCNRVFPTSACLTASCVKFVWVEAKQRFRYSSGGWDYHKVDACPGGGNSVGIYVRATHQWITGLFTSPMSINDNAVMKFEPQPVESCNADAPTPPQ